MTFASNSVRRAQPHLGTFVEVTAHGCDRPRLDRAVGAAFQAVAEVDRLMSFHEPDSDVSRLNREAGIRAVEVHPWTYDVLRIARDLHRDSGGKFDITVAPALQALGLLPRDHEPPWKPLAVARSGAVELMPGCRVHFDNPCIRIDLGGIAKGFAVDRAIEALRRHDVPSGCVNAGGDLAVFGDKTYQVGIRDPRCAGRMLCQLDIANRALASSARTIDTEHGLEVAPSAIIDPHSGAPTAGIVGASVLAPSCVMADALTKLVMILGESAAPVLKRYRAKALFVGEPAISA